MGKLFTPNLAEDVEKLKAKGIAITYPKIWSAKLDGIRVVTVEGDALTRSRKPVANKSVRARLTEYQNLDGEVIVGDPTDPECYSKTQSAVNSIRGEPDFRFYVFDHLRDLELGFRDRLSSLRQTMLPGLKPIMPPFGVIHEHEMVDSDEQLEAIYERLILAGYEGMMLRNLNAPYTCGRSTARSQNMLKVKPFKDAECIILAVHEAMHNGNESFINELGRTDRSTHQAGLVGLRMVGGFRVRDLVTGVEFDCAPGTLSHTDRDYLWAIRETLIGKMFTYRSMPYGIKVTTGVPRFPRFVFKGWREAWDL